MCLYPAIMWLRPHYYQQPAGFGTRGGTLSGLLFSAKYHRAGWSFCCCWHLFLSNISGSVLLAVVPERGVPGEALRVFTAANGAPNWWNEVFSGIPILHFQLRTQACPSQVAQQSLWGWIGSVVICKPSQMMFTITVAVNWGVVDSLHMNQRRRCSVVLLHWDLFTKQTGLIGNSRFQLLWVREGESMC